MIFFWIGLGLMILFVVLVTIHYQRWDPFRWSGLDNRSTRM